MKKDPSSKQPPQFDIFTLKAEAAWSLLHGRYACRISDAEVDHLFARFVFGLTSPTFGEGEPSAHFDICRALVSLKLPLERSHAALHAVPEPTQPWVESAYETIERQATQIGLRLAEQTDIAESRSPADVDVSGTGIKEELP